MSCLSAISLSRAAYSRQSSFASSPSCSRFSADSAERMVTGVPTKVMFLLFSNMPFITLAASGAQEPFSISATVRFW